MDTKPWQIPVVQIDTVGVHLFFSAVPRKTVRGGGGWVGRRGSTQTATHRPLLTERKKEDVKKNRRMGEGTMSEVKGMLHLSSIPQLSDVLYIFCPFLIPPLYALLSPHFHALLCMFMLLSNLDLSFTLLFTREYRCKRKTVNVQGWCQRGSLCVAQNACCPLTLLICVYQPLDLHKLWEHEALKSKIKVL